MTRLQRLVLGHGVAATAMAMPWPVLLVLTWDQTHSDTWLAVVGAARMAPYVGLSWAAGSLADRISRTTVIRLSAQARAVLLVGAAIAVHAGHSRCRGRAGNPDRGCRDSCLSFPRPPPCRAPPVALGLRHELAGHVRGQRLRRRPQQ